MVAGNSTNVASKFYCNRQYWLTKNTQLYWTLQNTLTYPTASAYTERLLKEIPSPQVIKEPLEGQLAVITNIAKDGSSYFVAEELGLTMGMDICLVGKNLKKLKQVELVLLDARRKRLAQLQETLTVVGKQEGNNNNNNNKKTKVDTSSIRLPKIHKIHMDSASLASVVQAAQDIQALVEENYNGKLPILIQNPSGVTVAYETTENGVEINVARNFVAPHVLTEKLLPCMQKAATESYKPRLILVSSVGHSQGTDFDPDRFLTMPDEGGAPEGTFQEQAEEEQERTADNNNTTKRYVENELDGPVIMYYRSRMALMANAVALAQENPWLAPISVYPGSVVTTSHSKTRNLGIAEMIYQTGFSMFQLDPTQAARASLRAALDPDFNPGGALSDGSYYLHCDGNPWTMADPNIENVYYSTEEYAAKVRECTQQLCQTLLESATERAAAAAAAANKNDKDKENEDGAEKEGDGKNTTKTEDAEQPSEVDLA